MTDVLPAETPRTTSRRAVTRDRLMTAAASVFAEKGIFGASVEEICETAGFTRGAFYSNFSDKDALVLALLEQGIDAQYQAAEQAIAAMKSAPGDRSGEQLVSYALSRFETLGRSSREAVLTQQELLLYAARRPGLAVPYQAFVEECLRQFATLIADAMTFSRLEFTCSFDDAIEMLTAAHGHMQLQSLFSGETDAHVLRSVLGAITRRVPAPA